MTDGPADEVRAAERVLREAIEWVLKEEIGGAWLRHTGLSDERLEELETRREAETKRRPSVVPSRNLLDYAELYELRKVIEHQSRWPLFKDVFHNRKRFQVWMDHLESYRNPTMHSRDLLPHEASLLRGIAGEIRNLITRARVETDELDQHFARIERVRDSFGHEATADDPHVRTDLTLRPGDVVTFTCEGFDPTGAELHWWWHVSHGASWPEHEAESDVIEWEVSDGDVAANAHFNVYLIADRKHHRNGSSDGHVMFRYRVLPRGS